MQQKSLVNLISSRQLLVSSHILKGTHSLFDKKGLAELKGQPYFFKKEREKVKKRYLSPINVISGTNHQDFPMESLPINISLNKLESETKKRKTLEYSLENYQRSNQDTCLLHRPAVFNGQWVQSGDLLADCASSAGGELSLGQNLLIAYMPWEGYNFEDAILISERLVFDDLYTSVHIEKYEIEVRQAKDGSEQITRKIPDISQSDIDHLDQDGIAKVGSWVEEGDILVGKTTPISKKNQTPYQKLLYTILEKEFLGTRDSSLRAPKGIRAKIIKIQTFQNSKSSSSHKKKETNTRAKIQKHFFSFEKDLKHSKNIKFPNQHLNRRSSEMNDSLNKKFSFLCSEKTILSNVSSKLERNSSTKFQSLFSFKDIKNEKRLNTIMEWRERENEIQLKKESQKTKTTNSNSSKKPDSQKKESTESSKFPPGSRVQLYLAEKRKVQVGDKLAGRHGNKGIISQILPIEDMPYLPDGTPIDLVLNPLGVPSRMNVGQIYECLLGLAGRYLGENYKIFPFDEIYGPEASRSFVYSKLNEARNKTGFDWILDPNTPGKMRLYDGRTGDCFDQAITVGQAYILRLVHMVDDKIHSRSTGPYSLVTQQPLRGRSKQGGQRLGEMEVWALEGYGAAFTLLEMLTIKSDDMTGRMTLWSNLILNQEISIGTPESFKVLICELQALCLDIGLFRSSSLSSSSNIQLKKKSSIFDIIAKPSLAPIENLMNLP